MKTKDLQTLILHTLSDEQYKREEALGNLDENAWYLTPEPESPFSDLALKWDTILVFDGGPADFQIAVLDETILL